jgi:hypothetical protein
MKKIENILETRLQRISDDETGQNEKQLPAAIEILRMIGNIKAENADAARRTRRLLITLKSKDTDLLLENEDHAFLVRLFEKNEMGLTAWAQGQILDILESAANCTPPLKAI